MKNKPEYKFEAKDFIPYSTRYAQRNPERTESGVSDELNSILLRKFGLMCYNGACTAVVFAGTLVGLAKLVVNN